MDFTAFTLFPNLPTELRLKVWAYACKPRNVSLCYLPQFDKVESSAGAPSVLQVNRESRYEALRVYSLCFATRTSLATTYFSASLDTVYIPRYRRMGYDETIRDFRSFLAKPEELDYVRWLALDYVEGNEKRPWEAYDKACLIRSFPALESVAIVLSKHRWNDAQHVSQRLLQNMVDWASNKEVVFVPPSEKAEEVKRACEEFREAWIAEENARHGVILKSGGSYLACILPPVEVVSIG